MIRWRRQKSNNKQRELNENYKKNRLTTTYRNHNSRGMALCRLLHYRNSLNVEPRLLARCLCIFRWVIVHPRCVLIAHAKIKKKDAFSTRKQEDAKRKPGRFVKIYAAHNLKQQNDTHSHTHTYKYMNLKQKKRDIHNK